MQEKGFVLCDPDPIYVERFMEYVQRRANFLFTLYGFTDAEEMERFLEEREMELGLISEEIRASMDEERWKTLTEKIGYPAVLSEQRPGERRDVIFRFQSMEQILRELVHGYERNCPETTEEGSQTRVTAFWSPVGRCGKTTCAILLGQTLARRQGMKVLYMNLEAFPGKIAGIRGQAGNSLSDHLYYRRMEGSGQRIMSLTDTVGSISVITPAVNPEDLWGCSTEELSELVEGIRNSGIYDLIILDLGSEADPVPILTMCSRIFLLSVDDDPAKAKLQRAYEYLTRDGTDLPMENLRQLIPPIIPAMRHREAGESCRELEDWLEKEWITWNMRSNEWIN